MVNPMMNKANFLKDLMFERNHPIYQDWNDWQNIVMTYYSDRTILLQKMISQCRWVNYDPLTRDFDLIDFALETKQLHYYEIQTGKMTNNFGQFITSGCFTHCICKQEFDYKLWGRVLDTCPYYEYHIKSNYLAILWSHYSKVKKNRSCRKYYSKLERVILSLSLKRLEIIPNIKDLIFKNVYV